MLTKSEREWAIKKSKWIKRDICYLPEYPPKEELIDAAEFSERVAAKLAITGDDWDFEDMPCRGDERQYMRINCKLRKNHWECADCYLKAARLKVEEELDADGKREVLA